VPPALLFRDNPERELDFLLPALENKAFENSKQESVLNDNKCEDPSVEETVIYWQQNSLTATTPSITNLSPISQNTPDHLVSDHAELNYADLEPLDELEIFNSVEKLINLPSSLDTPFTVEPETFDHVENNHFRSSTHHYYHLPSTPLPIPILTKCHDTLALALVEVALVLTVIQKKNSFIHLNKADRHQIPHRKN
jgi:hypothetical protein